MFIWEGASMSSCKIKTVICKLSHIDVNESKLISLLLITYVLLWYLENSIMWNVFQIFKC